MAYIHVAELYSLTESWEAHFLRILNVVGRPILRLCCFDEPGAMLSARAVRTRSNHRSISLDPFHRSFEVRHRLMQIEEDLRGLFGLRSQGRVDQQKDAE